MQRIIQLIIVSFIFIILPAQAEQVAGEVTAAMGEAQIVVTAGGKHAAVQGMQLHVGDILQTGIGGHMHIRMIDDALVSLRPNSKLKISSYTYQPGVTAATQIRLDLLQGTVRSVTGKGGQLAKDRFRMNTPLAAIGVRGTDFIAQTEAEKTLAYVASGAIVLAPFGAGCQENTLGSCQTTGARVLTAEMHDMMLELGRGMAEPRLVPLSNKLQINDPQAAGSAIKSQASNQTPADASTQVPVDASSQIKTLGILAAATPSQMVWGSWSSTQENGAVPFAEAIKGREVTVGNNMVGLFRDNSNQILLPQSGSVEFTLRSSQVSLQQNGGATAGQVQSGVLGVDFNAKTFDTQLKIQTPQTGPVGLFATGTVNNDGFLSSTPSGSNGTVKGSLSRNGAEAGYLFNLPTSGGGTLTGTTLWNK
jgi:hypothetical protein